MKKAQTLLLALFLAAAAGAHAEQSHRAIQIQIDVQAAVDHGDCAGAVKRLNEGLSIDNPQINLLAGTMFDHGICVKRDWNRALGMYAKAYGAGEHAAALRLAAGYAEPDRGPDIAAALWWMAHTNPLMRVEGCEVTRDPVVAADPDRFVALLKSWPVDKLRACNYATGLVATLAAEVRYPSRELANAMNGNFVLRFTPARGRIEIQSANTAQYQRLDGIEREWDTKYVTGTFEEHLQQVAQRALERYPRPEGIDPSWQFVVGFSFAID
jgi:hypothetical protein